MVLVFLTVDSFTSVPLLKEVRLKGTVQDLAVDVGVAKALVADNLEEGSAATAGPTKYQTHLSGLQYTLEVLQNVEFLALLADAQKALCSGENIKERNECVRESLCGCQLSRPGTPNKVLTAHLDIVLHTANTADSQSIPYNANALGLDSCSLLLIAIAA